MVIQEHDVRLLRDVWHLWRVLKMKLSPSSGRCAFHRQGFPTCLMQFCQMCAESVVLGAIAIWNKSVPEAGKGYAYTLQV